MSVVYDFCGYATKNNLLCSDGRTIRKDAFKECDGLTVPVVWNHRHDDPEMVLGHAVLENRKDGTFAYIKLNDGDKAKALKHALANQDLRGLSIYANQLTQTRNGDVLHGKIREVSVVLAGANPGALIDFGMSHSDDGDSELYYYLIGEENTELRYADIAHSDEEDEEDDMARERYLSHADEEDAKKKGKPAEDDDDEGGETIQEVFDTLTDKQKKAVYAIVGAVAQEQGKGGDDDDDEGEERMKHNMFDDEQYGNDNFISHSDQVQIITSARSMGSFRKAFADYLGTDEDTLMHDDDFQVGGFTQDTSVNGNVTWLFPEYKDVRPGAPELITNDMGWVGTVMNKVHKSPISRVRTQQVDIRNIESLKAKGYQKGKQKQLAGNFNLVRRTHDPQTVYVRNQLHRDDIIDITDFDYVNYLYNIDRMNLNETLAMAIMLGDFRDVQADDKIFPEHIRPIWTDDDLYTLHRDVDIEAARESLQGSETGSYFGDNYVYAEAIIEQALYIREDFKGTGSPDFFVTPHMLNMMLLARDRNGRRIFRDRAELTSSLNVNSIITAEQFANRIRTDGQNAQHKLLGIMVNLADYTVGATKGGEITHFTQFDIDFNGQKSLLETRCSGALTRVYSAAVLEEPVA